MTERGKMSATFSVHKATDRACLEMKRKAQRIAKWKTGANQSEELLKEMRTGTIWLQ